MSSKNYWWLFFIHLLAFPWFWPNYLLFFRTSVFPLCWFCSGSYFEMEFVTETSETAENIWIAASDGDIVQVQRFLDEGVPINAQDEYGYSPL